MSPDLLLYTDFAVHSQSTCSHIRRPCTQMALCSDKTKINNDFTPLIKHDLLGFWTGRSLIQIE